MKTPLLASAAITAAALLAAALPSVAQAELSYNVGVTTDYRYRGISQTRLKPALQGGLDFTEGGFYLGAWASTIQWVKDAKGSASVEIDLYGGFKGELSPGLGYDVGLLTYQYPSNKLSPSANTTEIYGAFSFGPATLKYSHSVSNLFGFAGSKNSGYLDLSAGFEVGGGVTLTPHLGYQSVAHNGGYSYTDYSLTASMDVAKGLTLSGALVGASTKTVAGAKAYASAANGKDLGKAGIVLGLKYAF